MGTNVGGSYGLYYYGWLAAGIFLGARWSNQLLDQGKTARRQLETVRALIIGYLVFLVPTAISNTVKPESREAIPSVMCGFAVIFALILTLYILPRVAEQKMVEDNNLRHA
jgi:membrane protein YdbS with pleckstrin-like domain